MVKKSGDRKYKLNIKNCLHLSIFYDKLERLKKHVCGFYRKVPEPYMDRSSGKHEKQAEVNLTPKLSGAGKTKRR